MKTGLLKTVIFWSIFWVFCLTLSANARASMTELTNAYVYPVNLSDDSSHEDSTVAFITEVSNIAVPEIASHAVSLLGVTTAASRVFSLGLGLILEAELVGNLPRTGIMLLKDGETARYVSVNEPFLPVVSNMWGDDTGQVPWANIEIYKKQNDEWVLIETKQLFASEEEVIQSGDCLVIPNTPFALSEVGEYKLVYGGTWTPWPWGLSVVPSEAFIEVRPYYTKTFELEPDVASAGSQSYTTLFDPTLRTSSPRSVDIGKSLLGLGIFPQRGWFSFQDDNFFTDHPEYEISHVRLWLYISNTTNKNALVKLLDLDGYFTDEICNGIGKYSIISKSDNQYDLWTALDNSELLSFKEGPTDKGWWSVLIPTDKIDFLTRNPQNSTSNYFLLGLMEQGDDSDEFLYHGLGGEHPPYVEVLYLDNSRNLTITNNGGNDFVTGDPNVTLTGTIDGSVASLWVNGIQVIGYSQNDISWNQAVTLDAGENLLEVEGRDAYGNLICSTQIMGTLDLSSPVVTSNPTRMSASLIEVTLSTNETATIYYTTDGKSPDETSQVYTSPINLTMDTTLNFFAVDNVNNSSTVSSENYVISDNTSETFFSQSYDGSYVEWFGYDLTSTYNYYQATGRYHSTYNPNSIDACKDIGAEWRSMDYHWALRGLLQAESWVYVDLDQAWNFQEDVRYWADYSIVRFTEDGYRDDIPTSQLADWELGEYPGYVRCVRSVDSDAVTTISPPTIDGGNTWYTNINAISLTGGTTSPNTYSLRVNGEQVQSYIPGDSTWSHTVTLSFGDNVFEISALDSSFNKSDPTIVNVVYDLIPPEVQPSVSAGVYAAAVSVSLSANEPSTIHYTLNNSEPTESSAAYSVPINISSDTVLKYFAVDAAGNASLVKADSYQFDSDDDGLLDSWEQSALGGTSQVAAGDLDADGLTNLEEYQLGTPPGTHNASLPDADGDHIPDAVEALWGFDANPLSDNDLDGFNNQEEYFLATDPLLANHYLSDFDDDGIPDFVEVANGGDPGSDDASADLDGDGLSNLAEYFAATGAMSDNRQMTDTDGDGIPDQVEMTTGLDADIENTGDTDGDGISDYLEYLFGTDPGVVQNPYKSDTFAPIVDTFTFPSTADSTTVTGISFTASDDVGVTGYLITENSTVPSSAEVNLSNAPSSYVVQQSIPAGAPTLIDLYAWARDDAGNVSVAASDSVTITLAEPNNTLPVGILQTGQKACLDGYNRGIECSGSGQDGDIRAGIPWPDNRFTDLENGTIQDEATGLVWLKDMECLGVNTWEDAINSVSSLNASPENFSCADYDGSLSGWRLPNANELKSILVYLFDENSMWLEKEGFVRTQEKYWTSTTDTSNSDLAFLVNTSQGHIYSYFKTSAYGTWAVHTGTTNETNSQFVAKVPQTGQDTSYSPGDDGDLKEGIVWPALRFTDNDDGTIIDQLTGLMWFKNVNCASTINYDPAGSGDGGMNWNQSLEFVDKVNSGSLNTATCGTSTQNYADWRLPNRSEIASLSDFSKQDPSLPDGHDFINLDPHGLAWTSSSVEGGALVYDIGSGATTWTAKTYDFPTTWLVRNGTVADRSLKGMVFDSWTGETLVNATVLVEGPISLSTYTNSQGAYEFNELPNGTYSLTAQKEGYEVGTEMIVVSSITTMTRLFNLQRSVEILPSQAGMTRRIDAGWNFALMIKDDNTLWSSDSSAIWTQVTQDEGWVAVSAGYDHSLALMADGSLWAWGVNSDGQLGLGTYEDKSMPARVGTEDDWVAIAAGGNHSLALKSNGTLWGWGRNQWGQLGVAAGGAQPLPLQIGDSSDWVRMAGGGQTSLALRDDGTIYYWGYLSDSSIPISKPGLGWLWAKTSGMHAIALRTDGTAEEWGWIGNCYTSARINDDRDWVGIAASIASTPGVNYLLKGDNTLWSSGGTACDITIDPVGTDDDWTQIAQGGLLRYAVKEDGTVWRNASTQEVSQSISSIPATKIIELNGNLSFGEVIIGQNVMSSLTISNTGTDQLTVSSINYPDYFSGNWSNETIAPGESQLVNVTFNPTSATTYSGTITVVSDATSGTNTISCSGTGMSLDTTPGAFSFTDRTDVALADTVVSNQIQVVGVNAPAPISIVGGVYSVDDGVYTSEPGTVTVGQTITVQVMSSSEYSITVDSTLTIGGVSDTFSVTTVANSAVSAEREALFALYTQTNGDNWTNNSGWLGAEGTECSWYGVTCNTDGHIETISLPSNGLSGTLPDALGQLSYLKVLDLTLNALTGTIPTELGQLSSLDGLFMHTNQLSGEIPADLGQLSDLRQIDLGSNQLSGTIPVELGQLSNLIQLSLGHNQLSGAIPVELGQLDRLDILYLSSNQFSGTIPMELGQLTTLEGLSLSNNQLSGTIPAELGQLARLRSLFMNSNQLSGAIPAELGQLSNLYFLDLSSNQLSGAIPAELGQLSNLYFLRLANNLLWGEIPYELTNLSNLYSSTGLQLCGNDLFTSDGAVDAFIAEKTGDTNWRDCMISPTDAVILLSGDLSFNEVIVGQNVTSNFTISNTGSDQLMVTNISCPDSFSVDWNSGIIASGESQLVNVTFSPTSATAYSGTITVVSDATSGTNTINCSGTGMSLDTIPDTFSFIDRTGVALGELIVSNEIQVIDINSTAPISIVGGTYSIGGGDYTSESGTVTEGQTVTVQVMSSSDYSTTADATLTIGGISEAFSVTTVVAPSVNVQTTVIHKISAGPTHAVAVNHDETVLKWGKNYYLLEDGSIVNTINSTPVAVPNLDKALSVASGVDYSMVLDSNGKVWAWGNNNVGQLGNGTITNSYYPCLIDSLPEVVDISAHFHSLAVAKDGSVWGWGLNSRYQLGNDTQESFLLPVKIQGLTNITNVSAGSAHTVAVKSDGTLWALGFNAFGQLGDGTTEDRVTPVQVQGLEDVIACETGDAYTVALKSDGTIWGWGDNRFGQLGDGTITDRHIPVQTVGIDDAIAIAVGNNHTLALRSDGTVWAWGWNIDSQLGDGTTQDRSLSIPISGLNNVIEISAGYSYSLALDQEGIIWSWGANSLGQLGLGDTLSRQIPDFIPDLKIIPPDGDGDGNIDTIDNCPTLSNSDQDDANNNGIGDACDTNSDTDSDGLTDAEEYVLGSDPSVFDRTINWASPVTTHISMSIFGNVSINDVPAEIGDEISVFDSNGILCGHEIIDSTGSYGDILIYGDNLATPTIDEGAEAGELLRFKIWDASAQRIMWAESSPDTVTWIDSDTLSVDLNGLTTTDGWSVHNTDMPLGMIDWLGVEHSPLTHSSYVRIGDQYYYVYDSATTSPLVGGGAEYTYASLLDCNHLTGEPTPGPYDPNGPQWADLTNLQGGSIEVFDHWQDITDLQIDIELREGWNLISVPLNNLWYVGDTPPVVDTQNGQTAVAITNINDLFSSIDGQYDLIRGFDAEGAKTYDSDIPENLNSLDYLAGGYGYWIKMNQPGTLSLIGDAPNATDGLQLHTGWNLIGHWGGDVKEVALSEGTSTYVAETLIGDALATIIDSIELVRGFDEEGAKTYDPAIPENLNTLHTLNPGQGYWIKLNQDAVLNYP